MYALQKMIAFFDMKYILFSKTYAIPRKRNKLSPKCILFREFKVCLGYPEKGFNIFWKNPSSLWRDNPEENALILFLFLGVYNNSPKTKMTVFTIALDDGINISLYFSEHLLPFIKLNKTFYKLIWYLVVFSYLNIPVC